MNKLALAILMVMMSVFAAYADNTVLKQAQNAGIQRCLPAIKSMSEFIIDAGPSGSHCIWNTNSPDTNPFTCVIERDYSDGPVTTNLSVTPMANGTCYAEYEKVFLFDETCMSASQSFEGSKYLGELNKEVAVLDHNDVKVYLIPFGHQCVVVLKEIIFDALKL